MRSNLFTILRPHKATVGQLRRRHGFRPAVEPLETRLTPTNLPPGFIEVPLVSGISNPTAMEFAPDGRLFVTQQGGQLRVIKDGVLLGTPFLTVSTTLDGERGLLGVAFDPDFLGLNPYVYVYYTVPTPPIHNRVSRFLANPDNPDVALPGSEEILLDLNNLSGATNHNGGDIHFGPDSKLYIGVGENANPANAQTLANLLGKVLRINPDGSIPDDNPFVNTPGARGEIWAYGFRNPFTSAFQPGAGTFFVNDVGSGGPGRREEINDVTTGGGNYGWPIYEGYSNDPDFVSPIFAYDPQFGGTNCAITGGTFYNPDTQQFPDEYAGSYFFSDLCGGWIKRIDPADPTNPLDFASGINPGGFNLVDLKVDTNGSLFYLGKIGGVVKRIDYVGGDRVAHPGRVAALQGLAVQALIGMDDGITRVQPTQIEVAITNAPVTTPGPSNRAALDGLFAGQTRSSQGEISSHVHHPQVTVTTLGEDLFSPEL